MLAKRHCTDVQGFEEVDTIVLSLGYNNGNDYDNDNDNNNDDK